MKFLQLIKDIPNIKLQNEIADFEVVELELDSRKITQNSIFFAVKGEKLNGEDFIEQAIINGAKAIVVDDGYKNASPFLRGEDRWGVVLIKTPNIKQVIADFATQFYNNIPKNIIAVTGTNGKTSVVNFIASMLALLGKKSASIGTLGVLLDGDFDKNLNDFGLTTPDILTLYKTLFQLKKQGVDYIAIEASSHGLHQNRFGNLKFDISCFTNLTQDHLDYHQTMENYFLAKSLIFSNFSKPNAKAILNADISEFSKLFEICKNNKLQIFNYGKNANNFKIINYKTEANGLNIEFDLRGEKYNLQTKLYGEFQVENLACAILAVYNLGFDIKEILTACENLKSVKGRMELVEIPSKKAFAVVDYAHTPDALEKAILATRKHTSKKLITLFGCGGDRDKTKRPLMGQIASKLSDLVIVTDDNPRTENASEIRKQILKNALNAKEIEDRRQAIKYAIDILESGDILLIAGKGHEDYQIIGNKKYHFSDVEEIIKYETLE